MASFNKITIVGFLGRDPELKYTPQGTANCKLSVATTEKRQDKEFTTWFRITVWGKQSELCNEYLRKGSQIYVEGRLRQEEYTDRDGQKRTTLEVNATDVQFLGKKSESGNQRDEAPAREDSQARRGALKTPQGVAKEAEETDEIPF